MSSIDGNNYNVLKIRDESMFTQLVKLCDPDDFCETLSSYRAEWVLKMIKVSSCIGSEMRLFKQVCEVG